MVKNLGMFGQSDMYALFVNMLHKGMRDDMGKVYRFCMVAQRCAVDSQVDGLSMGELMKKWKKTKKSLATGAMHEDDTDMDVAVRGIAYVVHRYKCKTEWVDMYLSALQADTARLVPPKMLEEQLVLMQELIEPLGLVCARVLGVKDVYQDASRAQARAFLQLSYIRCCGEDSLNGRLRFPLDELMMFGLKQLDEKEANKKPAEFREFMQYQVERYDLWQKESHELLRHIPLQARMTLNTARDAHDWIARQIVENPHIVFEQKVFPRRLRFVFMKVSRKLVF